MRKSTKVYVIEGIEMQFNSDTFNDFFKKKKPNGTNVRDFEEEISEAVGVSSDAVHSWRFGQNGPSDIEIIEKLAEHLDLSNFRSLLKGRKEKMEMHISGRQQDSLKKVYDTIMDFLWEFDRTRGFNDLWFDYVRMGVDPKHVEQKLYDVAENTQNKVIQVLQKEYLYLHKLDIYEALSEFVYDDLCDIYNGKLSYAYRFEAGVENIDGTRTTVTAEEDYTAALNKINDLLDPYLY